jgi:tripartite-type tricarboxylate transporter receptor subunit TctC
MAVISTGVPHVQSGKARALGVTGGKRAEALPDVPTIAEAGVKGYLAINWYGLSASPKTPPAILARMNKDFTAALNAPEASVVSGTREAFEAFVSQPDAYFTKKKREPPF